MLKHNKIILTLGLLLAAGYAFAAAPAAGSAAAPAAAPAKPAESAAPAKAAATGAVAKSQFTTAINNHEPADDISTLDNSHTRVYFWATLTGLQDQEVTFRWSYNDVTQGEWKTTPKAARWRTASSKELDPSKLGTWKVTVLDASGNELASKTFDYTKAEGGATAAPAAATK